MHRPLILKSVAAVAVGLLLLANAAVRAPNLQAQSLGSAATEPSVGQSASGTGSGASAGQAVPQNTPASACADFDSWCKYCASHPALSLCASYAPGNGVASPTGGVNPSDPGSSGAGGGDGGGGY
jgi:hypothetical protein